MKILIFGEGYVGSYLRHMLKNYAKVIGTTRKAMNSESHITFDAQDCTNSLFADNILTDSLLAHMGLLDVTHVLVSVPPIDGKDLIALKCSNFLKALPNLKWIGYLSSTSVYGDHGGSWVDEKSQTKPETTQGLSRLRAEHEWMRLADSGLPVVIFRLAGIYGPGRSVFDQISLDKEVVVPVAFDEKGNEQLFSRIYIDDIIQALIYSMENPTPGAIFNMADNMPASRFDVVKFAADLIGVKNVVKIKSDGSNQFHKDFKKVSNKALLSFIKRDLLYPDYKAGINHIYKQIN